MNKYLKKASVFIVFLLIVSSCKKMVESLSSLGSDNVSVKDLKEIDVNGYYKIAVPNYMTETKNLNDDASFQYANLFKESYAVVIDENKQEFINTFKELEIYKDSLSILENYTDYQVNSITESIEKGKFKKIEGELKIANSKQFEIYGDLQGLSIIYLVGFVEGKENIYMIMCWTLKDRFDKHKNAFHLIQNSIKLKK